MHPHSATRLPALLEAAAGRLLLAATTAVERTGESLSLAALAASVPAQRDTLLAAQLELSRRQALFALAFEDSLLAPTRRESDPGSPEGGGDESAWGVLDISDDREMGHRAAADRFGQEVSHACEWELRELEGYLGPLLGTTRQGNPLRPEVVGMALLKGIDAVSDRADLRALLLSELGRVLALEMRATYAAIVADLRQAGLRPAGLNARLTPGSQRTDVSGVAPLDPAGERLDDRPSPGNLQATGGPGTSPQDGPHSGGDSTFGRVEARMESLIRRLARSSDARGHDGPDAGGDTAANQIRAHRDELRAASGSSVDRLVIDVVGSLFDQILTDPELPPPLARQLGRLQFPVLRAALGDPSFFSSRRQPLRRFMNRIASLGAAIDDFGADDGQRLLARVRALVEGIVEGDFDRVETWEDQLADLEQFVAEAAREEARGEGGDRAAMLDAKEAEGLLGQRYAQLLQSELRGLGGPAFVRDFLVDVWSRVLVQAEVRPEPDVARLQVLRDLACELFLSVQPKGSQQARRKFLTGLPRLMQGLNQGMDLIDWPDPARKVFFGQLLPAQADALRAAQGSDTTDGNLLSRRVDDAFRTPLPKSPDLPTWPAHPAAPDEATPEPHFTSQETGRLGLVQESRIDWAATVDLDLDLDLGAERPVDEEDLRIHGLPAPEPLEPTQGRALAGQMQLGNPYRMRLDDGWRKVKLTHVSPGLTFYLFSCGQGHHRTFSVTHRMLARLCETGRVRAFESARLLERATARVRRQWSAINPKGPAVRRG